MNILLVSAGRRSYLVKYFQKALNGRGLVHATNSVECPSFHVADRHAISPIIYSEDYVPFMLEYCKTEHIRLLFPLLDIDIPVLARNKEVFKEIGTTVVVPDYNISQICNDKWRAANYLQENGFLVPSTALGVRAALEQIEEGQMSFPVVIKPRWGMASIGVHVAHNARQLDVLAEITRNEIQASYLKYESENDFKDSVIVQNYLDGTEYGLDIMCDLDGYYHNTSIKKKLGMRSGETDSAITVDNEVLKEVGQRLSQAIPHPGNLDVDVFLCDDKPFVLELNARFGGGYPFSYAAGANLPLALIEWAFGNCVNESVLSPEIGVYSYKSLELVTVRE